MIQFRLDYCTLYLADITALVSLTSQLYRLKYRESVTPRVTGVIAIYMKMISIYFVTYGPGYGFIIS